MYTPASQITSSWPGPTTTFQPPARPSFSRMPCAMTAAEWKAHVEAQEKSTGEAYEPTEPDTYHYSELDEPAWDY